MWEGAGATKDGRVGGVQPGSRGPLRRTSQSQHRGRSCKATIGTSVSCKLSAEPAFLEQDHCKNLSSLGIRERLREVAGLSTGRNEGPGTPVCSLRSRETPAGVRLTQDHVARVSFVCTRTRHPSPHHYLESRLFLNKEMDIEVKILYKQLVLCFKAQNSRGHRSRCFPLPPCVS